ncbi:MAG: amino acid--tRNA ligase-related protein, partial [Bacteroidota bacterium]
MQLSEQEIVRRNKLDQLRAIGVEPYPGNGFEVNFTSRDFNTPDFRKRLLKELEKLKSVGAAGAEQIADYLASKRYRTPSILEDTEGMTALKLSDPLSFDEAHNRPDESLEQFVTGLRDQLLGDFHPQQFPEVRIAGRFMGQRGPFAKLQDAHGRIQLYINKKAIGATEEEREQTNQVVKLLDIGDFIGIVGELFVTQTGEVTIKVNHLTFLSKSLRVLPIPKVDKQGNVYDAFNDPELRYRQRYVDLVVNPKVKDAFIKRTKMYRSIREYLDAKGYLEVETPILQPLYGGAAARPFKTHHNT